MVLWSRRAGGRPREGRDWGGGGEAPAWGMLDGGCGTKADVPGGPMREWLEPPGLPHDARLVFGESVGPPARGPRITLRNAVMEKMLSGSSPFCAGAGLARFSARCREKAGGKTADTLPRKT